MKSPRFSVAVFCLLCLLSTLTACGTTESMVDSTTNALKKIYPSSSPGLKKKVLVLPITDYAGAGPESATRIQKELIENMSRSDAAVFYETTEPLSRPSMDLEPEYGLSFPQKALEIAWESGMNAILSITLNAVHTTTKRGGPLPLWPSFLPFGETHQKYEVSLTVNLSDVRCGVLLLSHAESEEKTLSTADAQAQDPAQLIQWLLDETIDDIVEDQSEEIIEVLESAPWYGRILAVDGETVRISGGADVGIQQGMVFNVLGKGETIQCHDGRTLEILGPAIGQVQVTSVGEKEAQATPVATGPFLAGMIIQPPS